jgi:DNA-binding MarR family transcriptional regulator
MRTQELPEEYAIVLQQIEEDGEDNFSTLAEMVTFDRNRLTHIVQALQHKGLITITTSMQRDAWMRLTTKGKQLMRYVWPESGLQPSY